MIEAHEIVLPSSKDFHEALLAACLVLHNYWPPYPIFENAETGQIIDIRKKFDYELFEIMAYRSEEARVEREINHVVYLTYKKEGFVSVVTDNWIFMGGLLANLRQAVL